MAAKAYYAQARGGRIARKDKFIVPGDGVNLYDVPCFHLGPETIKELPLWIETALKRQAWFTLMIHGVGPDDTQWDNIQLQPFEAALDLLVDQIKYGLGVMTFAQAANCLRGGK